MDRDREFAPETSESEHSLASRRTNELIGEANDSSNTCFSDVKIEYTPERDPTSDGTTNIKRCQRRPLTILDGKFFEVVQEKSNNEAIVALCKKCDPQVVEVKGHKLSSSNFISHLKRKHGTESYTEYREYLALKTHEPRDSATKRRKSATNLTQSALDGKISTFIIQAMVPFRVVEHDSFVDLLNSVGLSTAKLKIPSRKTIVKRVETLFQTNNTNIRNALKDVAFVCTTADIWSGKKRSFLGVTVHWISTTYERKSAALACRRFKNSHTYERIAKLIQEIHLEFGLTPRKITATVTDNGSNFLKAFKTFGVDARVIVNTDDGISFPDEPDVRSSDRFELIPDSSSDPDCSDSEENFSRIQTRISAKSFSDDVAPHLPNHVRCSSHLLHLCASSDVKKGYKKYPHLLDMHNNVIDKCNELWNLANRPKSAEILQKVIGHTLSRPGVTRWNSLYDSLLQISKIEDKCPQLYRQLKVRQKLNEDDFMYIAEYIACSEPVANLLDILQGEENVFYGTLLPLLLALRLKLTRMENGKPPKHPQWEFCAPLVKIYLASLDARFGEFFDFSLPKAQSAAVAALANPIFKKRWLCTAVSENHETVLARFRSMVISEMPVATVTDPVSLRVQSESTSARPKYMDFLELQDPINVRSSVESTEALADTQISNYFIDPSSLFESLENYPAIKNVFLRTNTALPSSAPVERLFSFASITNSAKANRLSDRSFEMRVILKANLPK